MLEQLSPAQRERLAYIEFRLYFLGSVSRADLTERFGVAPAGATRDFAQYKELAPNNMEFDGTSKTYVTGELFAPIFEHIPTRVLTALSQGFGDGVNVVAGPLVTCEVPPTLNRIDTHILAPVTRAIHTGKAISIQYFSNSSGLSRREIVPFALACDGMRWHTRAYDRKNGKFIDLVISRMDDAQLLKNSTIEKHELPANDIQWNRIVELDLVPHPARSSNELVQRDYGMKDGVLHLKLRAAMAGYVLRQWHVDCSPNHSINDEAFRLWLSDPLALYGVESAKLAPGYKPPNTK